MDYTTDLKEVEDKIKRSRASGGGDAPEDLKGALDVAFKLDHRSPTLCAFLICDAPSHGKQYHDHHDDHPNQPEGSLEAAVRRFSQIKGTECYFTAMQLNNSTNKMFRMMKEAFGNNFLVTDKMIPKDFFSTMFNSMTTTIEETRLRFDPSKLLKKHPESALETIAEDTPATVGGKVRIRATSKAPVLPKIRQFEIDDLDYWKNFKDEIESRVLRNQTELVFDPTVIGTGKTSSVFKLYDTKRRVEMVCKIDFRTIEGDADAAYETAYNRWVSQIYSLFMANLYRHLTCELNAAPIFFLPPMLYELEQPFKGAKVLYAEPYIGTGDWGKYTNNYDYCVKQTMSCFSHFSHVQSQCLFMITDLQGSGNLLSDPAIHSQDTALFRERTNLRQKGILAFYGKDVHSECNQVCEKLGLACKRPDAEGSEGAVRVVDDADLFCKDDDLVDFICDLCLKISKL